MSELDFKSSYERSFLCQADPSKQESPEQQAYTLKSWRSIMEQTYGDLDFNSDLNGGFHAGLRVSRLQGFNAFAIRGTELTAQRTLRQTRDEETNQIIMIWQLSGEATAAQRGNEVEIKSGEIVFLDFDTPYEVDCRTRFNQFVVQIPKKP